MASQVRPLNAQHHIRIDDKCVIATLLDGGLTLFALCAGYPECLLPHGISIVGAFVTVHGSSGDNGEAQLLSMAKAAVLRVVRKLDVFACARMCWTNLHVHQSIDSKCRATMRPATPFLERF